MSNFIEIRLTKCLLFLTESEITGLLSKDLDLWKEAIKRGKGISRARANASRPRKVKKPARHEFM